MSASARPLWPPVGASRPAASARPASVVGRPSSSSAQPSGIGRPSAAASLMRPSAVWLIAMSRTSGGCGAARGTAMASGLLPTSGAVNPAGAMTGCAFVSTMPTSPRSARRSAYSPAIPKWWLSRTPTDGHALLGRDLGRQLAGHDRRRVAVAAVGVDERARGVAAGDPHVGRGAHVAGRDGVVILDQPEDPVARHPPQLGRDEAVGGQRCVAVRHPDRTQDTGRERREDGGVHQTRVTRAGRTTARRGECDERGDDEHRRPRPDGVPERMGEHEQRKRDDQQRGRRPPPRDGRRGARAPQAAGDEHDAAEGPDAREVSDAEGDQERERGGEGHGTADVHAPHRSRWRRARWRSVLTQPRISRLAQRGSGTGPRSGPRPGPAHRAERRGRAA